MTNTDTRALIEELLCNIMADDERWRRLGDAPEFWMNFDLDDYISTTIPDDDRARILQAVVTAWAALHYKALHYGDDLY